ncbi:NIPSNAP family containing protein, partial [bacterium I07]
MKSLASFILIIGLLFTFSCEQMNSNDSAGHPSSEHAGEFYQLKTYIFDTDEQEQITDSYLKQAFLPGLKRLGINNIGVFKPRPETNSPKKIYVLIPFSSLAQFLNLEESLAQDETHMTAGAEYINAGYQSPPYKRLESTLMKAFEDMPFLQVPQLDSPRKDRIYELRSYESPTELYHKKKVEMFNAGGEVKLFKSLDFNAVFYAAVISGSKMPNLMYMTTFANQASRDAHWDTFRKSPQWLKLKAVTKYLNSVS